MRVESGYAAYTGQTGDAHTGYPGMAIIAFTALPTMMRQTLHFDSLLQLR